MMFYRKDISLFIYLFIYWQFQYFLFMHNLCSQSKCYNNAKFSEIQFTKKKKEQNEPELSNNIYVMYAFKFRNDVKMKDKHRKL